MTRKRFIKLMMSWGYGRNAVNDFVRTNPRIPYFRLWFLMSPKRFDGAYSQRPKVTPRR